MKLVKRTRREWWVDAALFLAGVAGAGVAMLLWAAFISGGAS